MIVMTVSALLDGKHPTEQERQLEPERELVAL
jgi:hypothetical protein